VQQRLRRSDEGIEDAVYDSQGIEFSHELNQARPILIFAAGTPLTTRPIRRCRPPLQRPHETEAVNAATSQ
jgi:hypothetical protein